MAIESFTGKYRFLSNFWPAEVVFDGNAYQTVEHAYQAAKAATREERKRIWESKTPGEAKKLGRTVTLRKDWEVVKEKIMYDLVWQKFSKSPELTRALLDTGNEELIEGNNWGDTFWGKDGGVGENHLGKILMQIREKKRIQR